MYHNLYSLSSADERADNIIMGFIFLMITSLKTIIETSLVDNN